MDKTGPHPGPPTHQHSANSLTAIPTSSPDPPLYKLRVPAPNNMYISEVRSIDKEGRGARVGVGSLAETHAAPPNYPTSPAQHTPPKAHFTWTLPKNINANIFPGVVVMATCIHADCSIPYHTRLDGNVRCVNDRSAPAPRRWKNP